MKKKDLIRIVYEKIMLAIGVMIANLVMNETIDYYGVADQ